MPATELYENRGAEIIAPDEVVDGGDGVEFEVVNEEGKVVMRTNQHTVDDPKSQKLSSIEIEALKSAETSSGKDIIAKILESHSALDKKTAFALAKYTLRKTRKFLKRFTPLPLDVPLLTNWLLNEKDPIRIMEIREEILALVCSWANIHWSAESSIGDPSFVDTNRWLAVEETSGLVVAAMAERLGILHPPRKEPVSELKDQPNGISHQKSIEGADDQMCIDTDLKSGSNDGGTQDNVQDQIDIPMPWAPSIHIQETAMSATHNTITLIHANPQPNISLLDYFGYSAAAPNPTHPLHTHLKTLTWLQLLHPEEDSTYREPETLSDAELAAMKSSKRGAYHRKRRRWQRIKSVVDETREGGFAGLIIASAMASTTILHRLVPLLRGGAQVVVYSPSIEPLTELMDAYSKLRRTAFGNAEHPAVPSEEFPVNPHLLLAPAIHTARARPWQVLPGRTHPKMMGRGGSEGYVFVATRVLPAEGKVAARGIFKRRKVAGVASEAPTPIQEKVDTEPEPANAMEGSEKAEHGIPEI